MCVNDPVCAECKQPGHKKGDPRCSLGVHDDHARSIDDYLTEGTIGLTRKTLRANLEQMMNQTVVTTRKIQLKLGLRVGLREGLRVGLRVGNLVLTLPRSNHLQRDRRTPQ